MGKNKVFYNQQLRDDTQDALVSFGKLEGGLSYERNIVSISLSYAILKIGPLFSTRSVCVYSYLVRSPFAEQHALLSKHCQRQRLNSCVYLQIFKPTSIYQICFLNLFKMLNENMDMEESFWPTSLSKFHVGRNHVGIPPCQAMG